MSKRDKIPGSFLGSFGFAFQGLREGWVQERNFRVQCAYALSVVLLLLVFRPEFSHSLLVVFALSCLLTAELFNSALERLVDLAVDDYHPLARAAKDLSASAVLMVAMSTALLNLLVFGSLLPWTSGVALLGFWGWFFCQRFLNRGDR